LFPSYRALFAYFSGPFSTTVAEPALINPIAMIGDEQSLDQLIRHYKEHE